MLVKYDSLDRFETPILTLCNPGSVYNDGTLTNVVGILTDVTDVENVFNFNSQSELNFRVYKIRTHEEEYNNTIYNLYRSIQNRRLVYMDGIGYFMITNIVDGFDGQFSYKDVTAMSIEIEIQQKMIPYIADGTYPFSTDELAEKEGLLETLVATLPLWTIGDVDSEVSSRYRTFEDVDTETNVLAFMLENMQDAYECIFIFDPINRQINVYDQNNYVRRTDIHITKDDLVNSLDITENADDLYTAMSVLGDDNVTISAINPLGTNTIYDFSYYYEWMSDSLGEKVEAWQQEIENHKETYYDLNLDYYQKLAEASNTQAEINKLNIQLTMYNRCRDNIIAEGSTNLVDSYNKVIINNGGEPIEVYEEIAETIAYIDNLIAEVEYKLGEAESDLETINGELETVRSEISEITESLSFANYFTSDELTELMNYVFEGAYQDEYVVITDVMDYEAKFEQMKILYDRAEQRLSRVSVPTQEFDIDVENFIFAKEFANWTDELETGCLINVELDLNDIAELFLSNITINYEDHSLSMTFGNRFNKFDPKTLFDDVLGEISKSANTIDYLKELLYPIKSGEFNAMKEALQTSRDLTMADALSSSNEEVLIDGSGYTGRTMLENGTYDPRQIKITGRHIVMTDDGWETAKVAIGEILLGDNQSFYGINAEAIIGDIIMGNNLRIVDSNGNDIFTVVDGRIEAKINPLDGRLTVLEQDADSVNIRITALENADDEVDHVTTTTGYTFNADGLFIHKDGEEIINKLDNTGMYVSRSGENILTANAEGVDAINLTARQYLTIGANSRFEDYSNGTDTHRTACFYVGE